MEKQLCRADGCTAEVAFGGLEAPVSPLPIAAAWVGRVVEKLLAWQERSRQRFQLLSLSDHALKDVGLSRADVEQEAGKPFWRS